MFDHFAGTSYRVKLNGTMMTKAINENFNSLIGKWKFAKEQKSTYTVLVFQENSKARTRNYNLYQTFFTITEMMIMYTQLYQPFEILLFCVNEDFVKDTTEAY